MRVVGSAAPGAIALLALLGCAEPVHESASWTGPEGLPATVDVFMTTEPDAKLALREAREAIERIDALMGHRQTDGELARLNRQASEGYYEVQDADLYRCLLLAFDYAKASRGAFDPTVGVLAPLYRAADGGLRSPGPEELAADLELVGWEQVTVAPEARAVRFRRPGMRVDLGGVAKGFALDAAARTLTRPGSRAASLRLGGNFYAWNSPPGQEAWALPIPDPRHPERLLLTVQVANRGVSVSGQVSGSRGLVLDPQSGRPVAGDVLAAVAIADSAADADALSTALVASGYHRAADLLGRMRHVEAVLLLRGETAPRVLASGTLTDRLEISADLDRETEGNVRYLLPPRP